MKSKFIVVFVILGLIIPRSLGQSYKATAKLDSTSILIGDYLNVHLEVAVPKGNSISFPKINDQFFTSRNSSIEWIQNSKIDTIHSGNLELFRQTVTFTAFDSGQFVFPSIPILSKDSLILTQTDSLYFNVTTIPVDTTAAYKDIKGNVKTPFTFHEFWLYMKKYGFLILLITILVGLCTYLVVKYLKKKRKKYKPIEKIIVPKEKAHIIAFKALEHLRKKKLWEQGKVKDYYSELTDIIRTYLENRWRINAMEMVSSEILDAIKTLELSQQEIDHLQKLFQIADLVKFAKWDPLPTDHDIAFKSAHDFIEKTADYSESTHKN